MSACIFQLRTEQQESQGADQRPNHVAPVEDHKSDMVQVEDDV